MESDLAGAVVPPERDELLFGWDPTPGIVSIWADREGQALVWRRVEGRVVCERERYRPWLFAAHLDDLADVGSQLADERDGGASAPFSYRELGERRTENEERRPKDQAAAGDPHPSSPILHPSSFRYLVSARNGRALERAIITGASRRLGRPVRSLYDLEADYHRVGAVEQYLMATGRVCFRGMAYDDLHRMQIDLETTALSPSRGRIFMAAVRDSRGLALTLDAPEPGDERRLLLDLLALVRERDPDVIENHNLFGFDLPFLEGRAAALGVPLALGRPEGPAVLERYEEPGWRPGSRRARYTVAGRELIDTLDAVRRHDFVARDLPSHRLKEVARHFGVATADRVYLPGAEVYATYRSDREQVRRYALDDVAEVDALSRRLLGAPFALAGMAPRRYERVASAGPAMGILEPMLVRAYLRAGAALPRPADERGLPPHTGGALHLFATGIGEQVVKADIASLYPSLMRTFQIGPVSDRLGALLHIVGRVLDLRLHHKNAAKAAAPGSLEAGYHGGMQAAMKLLINSAYGYMGAGQMALFADRAAADEVTRRGRDVLWQVVEALRARGVVLIEADTDGVYFAVPKGWSEEQERALVAEVAALLPDGIRLDYEGRYRAMLSHEVKNYALLTYDGQLIMRGVALRSSRSEPFGERFLARALRCAMTGDIGGLRQAFLETVAAIRARELPASDLAARVRLSKTPDEYRAARGREAAYEALLAAGRSSWTPGERVRCYRAEGGGFVWLPDEDGEQPEEEDDPATDDRRPRADQGSGALRLTFDAQRSTDDQLTTDKQPSAVSNRSLSANDRRDYDVEHYVQLLVTSYASRLKKAFAPEDFAQLFRLDAQLGMFDRPIESIEPLWIRSAAGSAV